MFTVGKSSRRPFLGYHYDLNKLVVFVVGHTRPRLHPKPMMHVLMISISQLAVTESLVFPEETGPFRLTGAKTVTHVQYIFCFFWPHRF